MERMLSKLEFMLMGLRQLTLSAVYAWFPELKGRYIRGITTITKV